MVTVIMGTCECNEGYGKNSAGECTIDWAGEIVGSFLVTDDCVNNNYAISVSLEPSNNGGIFFRNFQDTYNNVYAKMTSATTFEIPLQMQNATRVAISGLGNFTNLNALSINFILEYTSLNPPNTCSASYTKLCHLIRGDEQLPISLFIQ